MFDIDDRVVTARKVNRETRDLLMSYGITPGTEGTVVGIQVTVDFDKTVLTLDASCLEPAPPAVNATENISLDGLMKMFGVS